jgi:hypothetical protein
MATQAGSEVTNDGRDSRGIGRPDPHAVPPAVTCFVELSCHLLRGVGLAKSSMARVTDSSLLDSCSTATVNSIYIL